MVPHTDEELLDAIREGQHTAFTELYNRYWRKLFVAASNKLKDSATAEELTQDIFADIWARRERLHIHSSVSAYLAVALKYKVIDLMAREQLQRRYREQGNGPGIEWDDSTRQWLDYEELRHRLEKLVSKLPEKCRIVYELRQDGHSQKEIAGKMGISVNTVENHLAKAYKTIREQIKQLSVALKMAASAIF